VFIDDRDNKRNRRQPLYLKARTLIIDLKRIIKNILIILTQQERRKFFSLTLFNLLISLVDIASLATLVIIIGFYTGHPLPAMLSFLGSQVNGDSIALLMIFLLLFILKSLAGYYITQMQYRFVYQVASRISETNMLRYLEGSYTDYVNVDSAVNIRKISQLPVEFAQYVYRAYSK